MLVYIQCNIVLDKVMVVVVVNLLVLEALEVLVVRGGLEVLVVHLVLVVQRYQLDPLVLVVRVVVVEEQEHNRFEDKLVCKQMHKLCLLYTSPSPRDS